MKTFAELELAEPLLRAVSAEGYTTPTPIQVQAIPHVLAARDLLGIAQTGTGKTAAFALPILQRLAAVPPKPGQGRSPRVLVLAPTRELAAQIAESFQAYGRNQRAGASSVTVIFGGVGQDRQVRELARAPAVLVATPGRLLDLLQQRHLTLGGVEVFVLDEADRMLDMGFIHDVRRIAAQVPRERQTLLFSATMPDEVASLAANLLRDPVRVEVTPQATTVEKIVQSIYFVEKPDKRVLLANLLRDDRSMTRVLVFTRTKHGANRVVKELDRAGFEAEAIHGNKAQTARERALANFKRGATRVLVATDIAARGLDVEDVSHVVNYDLPNIPESYVHRIGRTARAGASGIALSFCDAEERAYLVDIERLIRAHIPRARDHQPRSHLPPPAATMLTPERHASRRPAPRPTAPPFRPHAPRPHAPRPPAAPTFAPAPAASPAPASPAPTAPAARPWSSERRPPAPIPGSRRPRGGRSFGPRR